MVSDWQKMWARLLHWRSSRYPNTIPHDGYRIYTTQYDRVVTGDKIEVFLARSGREAFAAYAAELDVALTRWRAAAEVAAVEAVAKYRASAGPEAASDTIACLLLDHSGSLRGQRAIIATAIAQIVADLWSRIGIRYEILGFTTQSWHGGRARQSWIRAGRPSNPGRLCELLHIVYRSAGDTSPGAPWAVCNLNRPALLKENVDGEAIEWAAQRLLLEPENRKLMLVVSDGAPVDDSTLLANDQEYLERHLRSVLAALPAKGIRFGAVGLGDFAKQLYPEHVLITVPEELASQLVPFVIEKLLLPNSH